MSFLGWRLAGNIPPLLHGLRKSWAAWKILVFSHWQVLACQPRSSQGVPFFLDEFNILSVMFCRWVTGTHGSRGELQNWRWACGLNAQFYILYCDKMGSGHIPAKGTYIFYYGQLSTISTQKNKMELGSFPFSHSWSLSSKATSTQRFLIFKWWCLVNYTLKLTQKKDYT